MGLGTGVRRAAWVLALYENLVIGLQNEQLTTELKAVPFPTTSASWRCGHLSWTTP